MIEAKDIGILFATMRSHYGHLWAQTSAEDAAEWLRRLGGYSREDIRAATDRMPDKFKKHPPTLGQFEAEVGGLPKRANTYLPPPDNCGKMPYAEWKKLNGVE